MTIAEVSRKYDISIDTLRYYERIGLIPSVHRSKSGIRDYTQTDLNWVEFVKCMRGAGLPVDALVAYVGLCQQGDATIAARKDMLIEQRRALAARIAEMRRTLERLDAKIEHYESHLVPVQRALMAGTKPEANAGNVG